MVRHIRKHDCDVDVLSASAVREQIEKLRDSIFLRTVQSLISRIQFPLQQFNFITQVRSFLEFHILGSQLHLLFEPFHKALLFVFRIFCVSYFLRVASACCALRQYL